MSDQLKKKHGNCSLYWAFSAVPLFIIWACSLVFVQPALAMIQDDGLIISSDCQQIIDQHEISDFSLDDRDSSPFIVQRSEASHVEIKYLVFDVPFFQGLLVRAWDKQIIHCWDAMEFTYFVLAEQVEFHEMIGGAVFQHAQVHVHNKWDCGSPCVEARVHTIDLINGPYQSRARMVYQSDWGEYPSRWFRAYLTNDERTIFDQIIEDG